MRILLPCLAPIALCRLALILAVALSCCTALHAQDVAPAEYDQLKVNPSLKNNGTKVSTILRKGEKGESLTDDDKKLLDDYFKSFFLSRWTAPADKTKLAYVERDIQKGYRAELRNSFRLAKSGPPYDYLNDLVLAELSKMAAGNYQPAARFNAMLAIGELNALEVGITETPKPLPKALGVLVGALKDAKQTDAVKVAALVGINRHVKLGAVTDPAARTAVTNELLKFIAAVKPPQGRTNGGHDWMRSQAAEILGRLGEAGAKGDVVYALAALAADQDAAHSARRDAVRALGGIKYDEASRAQAGKAAKAVAQFTCNAWNIEDEKGFSRRRFKDCMAAVYFGVHGYDYAVKEPKEGFGLAEGTTDATGKKTMAIVKPAVQSIMDAMDDPKNDDLALMKKIGDRVSEIRRALPDDGKDAAAQPNKGRSENDS